MAIVAGPTRWQSNIYYALGASPPGGGRVICLSGGIRWIVAPNTTEVSRNWYCRNDAVTTAQNITQQTGWFVPTCAQLQNPGYTCRIYWDSYSSAVYWTSTERVTNTAWNISMVTGQCVHFNDYKNLTQCVRAFRCVTY